MTHSAAVFLPWSLPHRTSNSYSGSVIAVFRSIQGPEAMHGCTHALLSPAFTHPEGRRCGVPHAMGGLLLHIAPYAAFKSRDLAHHAICQPGGIPLCQDHTVHSAPGGTRIHAPHYDQSLSETHRPGNSKADRVLQCRRPSVSAMLIVVNRAQPVERESAAASYLVMAVLACAASSWESSASYPVLLPLSCRSGLRHSHHHATRG
jgi:hypothetical protein